MGFTITKKRIVEHYGRKAKEKYTFRFSDGGELNNVRLDVFEADADHGSIFEAQEYRVAMRDPIPLSEVPCEILEYASDTLLRAAEEV